MTIAPYCSWSLIDVDEATMISALRTLSPTLAKELEQCIAQPGKLGSAQEAYLLFEPESIATRAQQYFGRKAATLETWRNLLIFVPILWTWLAIGTAGLLFQRSLTVARSAGSDGVAQLSFIAEWERGFGWEVAGWHPFTFSSTAYISGSLIVWVMVMTLRLRLADREAETGSKDFLSAYGDSVRNVAAEAENRRRKAENERWSILEEIQQRGPQKINQAIEGLVNALAIEEANIRSMATARGQELDTLEKVSSRLEAATQGLIIAATGIEGVYGKQVVVIRELGGYIHNFEERVKHIAETARAAQEDFKSVSGSLGKTAQSLNELAARVEVTVQDTTEIMKNLKEITTQGEKVVSGSEQLLKEAETRIGQLQTREDALINLLGHTIPQLNNALENNALVLAELDESRGEILKVVKDELETVQSDHRAVLRELQQAVSRLAGPIASTQRSATIIASLRDDMMQIRQTIERLERGVNSGETLDALKGLGEEIRKMAVASSRRAGPARAGPAPPPSKADSPLMRLRKFIGLDSSARRRR